MKIVVEINEARYKDIQRIAEVQLESNYFRTAEQIIAKSVLIEQDGDTISRQKVLEVLKDKWNAFSDANDAMQESIDTIEALPSVNPQPEIIRCGQCKYAEVADPEDSQDGYTCQFHRGSIWFSGSYCSWAERRQDG